MGRKLRIKCHNDNQEYKIAKGTNIHGLINIIQPKLKYEILGVKVNNELQELDYEIYKPKHIKFVDITDPDGHKMYVRSLTFVLIKAFKEKFPNAVLKIAHSISGGLYCEIEGLDGVIYGKDVESIQQRMKEIVDADMPFVREEVENNEAIKIYEDNGMFDKSKLFQNRKLLYTSVYYLDDTVDYFYGYLVPSTRYVDKFDLVKYHDGLMITFPSPSSPEKPKKINPQQKMFDIFKEHKDWAKILGVDNVGILNDKIIDKGISNLIKISEALHEKKIAKIADEIFLKKDRIKLILIAGPSSSGKTSFCKRLSVQLQVLGFKTFNISMDDYFVEREQTPKDANGDFDFECLEAVDTELFNKNMLDLMAGKEVDMPKFDFTMGKKFFSGKKVKADENTIFIFEGIHGLNPGLTSKINDDVKFKIYVSALTQIAIDYHNRIPTTDNRVIRRMVRDFKYRGYSSFDTLKRWPSVRRGEARHIFPFQEEADEIFNSALLYEFAVLKKRALPILNEVPQSAEEYSEARRLIKFLSYFEDIPKNVEKEIPPTSIIREFIGGSSFKY
jgi:uridine kinase